MSDFDIKHYARESKKAIEQLITENDQLRAENEALKQLNKDLVGGFNRAVKREDEQKKRAEQAESELNRYKTSADGKDSTDFRKRFTV